MPLGEKTKLLWNNPIYRQKMSIAHIGQKAWNRGKKIQTNTGRTHFKKGQEKTDNWRRAMEKNSGPNHPLWKGDGVGYNALHSWVHRHFGSADKCEHCKNPRGRFEWANKSGKYLRDRNDWLKLCRGCHTLYDKDNKFGRMRPGRSRQIFRKNFERVYSSFR
jgi:hypothetical protein